MGTSGNRDCKWAFRSVLKNFTEMRCLSQPVVCSKMGQSELWGRIGDGAYSIAAGETSFSQLTMAILDIHLFCWKLGRCEPRVGSLINMARGISDCGGGGCW